MSTLPMDEKRREAIKQAWHAYYRAPNSPNGSNQAAAFEQALRAAGYAVVPVEPTPKMKACGESNWSMFCNGDVREAAARLYRAMIAASSDGKVVAG